MPIFKGKKYVQGGRDNIPYILRAADAVEGNLYSFESEGKLIPFQGGTRILRSALAKVFRAGKGRHNLPYVGVEYGEGFDVVLGARSIQVGCTKFKRDQFKLLRRWALARRRKA
jgi:hypothetical protein